MEIENLKNLLVIKKTVEVSIDKQGFSESAVSVPAKQKIIFLWTNEDAEDEEIYPYSIFQVVDDDSKGKYVPVVGGIDSGKPLLKAKFEVCFKTPGIYKFKIKNHPLDPPPCVVTITEEEPVVVTVTDEGFFPRLIHIEEFTTVKWEWKFCKIPHSIYESNYCEEHVGLFRTTRELVIPTCTNFYEKMFDATGTFYFETQSKYQDQKHICIVVVIESNKDYKVEVMDDQFAPMKLVIEEGDRVLFEWNKESCVRKHCIFEISLPSEDHDKNDEFIPKVGGFAWHHPTKNGLVAKRFKDTGIYYYSDKTDAECASYIGVIIVKPKPITHVIQLDPVIGDPEIKTVGSGEIIWWRWDNQHSVQVSILDSELMGEKKLRVTNCEEYAKCDEIKSNSFTKLGSYFSRLEKPGIYHFNVQIDNQNIIYTIVAYPPEKDHKVQITDQAIDPPIVTVNPHDRVWFMWDDAKKPHNVRQVTHQNKIIPDGFICGSLLEPPGAFMLTFVEHGIYYFRSDNLKNCIGAIVVVPEPTIHAIQVTEEGLNPDPLVVNVNDIVLWLFHEKQSDDLVAIANPNDLLEYPKKSKKIIGRKCLVRKFKETGAYHFASPSFNKVLKKNDLTANGYENIILSSVIVDKSFEYVLVYVDSNGFHPDNVNIAKGKSILFDWKESNQSHNIVNVEFIDDERYRLVEDSRAFNSGEPVINSNFLYTFEQEGLHSVISYGADGYYCLINVMQQPQQTESPKLVNNEPYIVDKYHSIHLSTPTPDAKIYYTTNGMQPNKQSAFLKLYNDKNGIILTEAGFSFIRAIAIAENHLISDVYTSQRFFVNHCNKDSIYGYGVDEEDKMVSDWWRAIPRISKRHLDNGKIEIYWDKPSLKLSTLISHYQLYLNGVSYKESLFPSTNSVLLSGLTAGRQYETTLMIYPKSKALLPQQSNKIIAKCPLKTESGAPIVSLRRSHKSNEVTITWSSVDTPKNLIDFYQLMLDNKKFDTVASDSQEYITTLRNITPNEMHTLNVVAVPRNGVPLVSNQIVFTLPLDLNEINLPDPDHRKEDADFYEEYIEIEQGEHSGENAPNAILKYDITKTKSAPPPTDLEFKQIEENLDSPKVIASNTKPGSLLVEWSLAKAPPKPCDISYFIINLIGTEFGSTIKSDASFDCFMNVNAVNMPAIQHSWNIDNSINYENRFLIDGILDTSIYEVNVIAVYVIPNKGNMVEVKKHSPTINHISLGPPHPPKLIVTNLGLQSVTIEWSLDDYPKPEYISGYRLIINSEYKHKFDKNKKEHVLNDLQPGNSYKLELVALTNSVIGQSLPSKAIEIKCPLKPRAPLIFLQPTVQVNSAMIGWKTELSQSSNKEDQIWMYRIYINDKFHGEIFSSNLSSYSYLLSDLVPGEFYDITVKALCGQRLSFPTQQDVITCLILSESSNVLPTTPTAPPQSPVPKIDSINHEGIDLIWSPAKQYGDATLSGYYLIKNGKIIEDLISPEATTIRVRDLRFGEESNFQLMALTEHPCGQYSTIESHPNFNREFALQSNTNFVDDSRSKYSACKSGPSLIVAYTGITVPVQSVIIEKLTGYSGVFVWKLDDSYSHNKHFVKPEFFAISYWPGEKPNDNTQILITKKNFIEIGALKPSTKYTMRVESRKTYKFINENLTSDDNENVEYSYLSYSSYKEISFETASPPDPPSNLSLVLSTCHALKICWDKPVDNGSEIIATRILCFPVDFEGSRTIYKDFTPDITECAMDNLSEKTLYRFVVIHITREYMLEHNVKEVKQLPHPRLESAEWLPSASIDAITSGTDPACELKFTAVQNSIPHLTWKISRVYGTNELISQIVCFTEIDANNVSNKMASQVVVPTQSLSCDFPNMRFGSKYKVWVETVVSIKININDEPEMYSGQAYSHFNQLKDRRTINVVSEPIFVRVPAPCEAPFVLLNGYTLKSIDLYWPKPCMHSDHVDPDDRTKTYNIYRKLLGYRIEVNGINQKEVGPKENGCTIIHCKPSKVYSVVLIARTCLIDVSKNGQEIDLSEIDESYSKPLQVKIPPENELDKLTSISAKFEPIKGDDTIGQIKFKWDTLDTKHISQFNATWFFLKDSIYYKKSLDSTSSSCIIPVKAQKCVYELNLETVSKGSKIFTSEKLNIEVPGSPDAPKIWLKSMQQNVCTVMWCEPRVYPNVPCSGYQLYVNNIKNGGKIEFGVNQVSLTLKPNRVYKIAIQALTSHPDFSDSEISNQIEVITQMNTVGAAANDDLENGELNRGFTNPNAKKSDIDTLKEFYIKQNATDDEASMPLKIAEITEDYIDLDWSNTVINKNVEQFKIQWHCLNTNSHDEDRLPNSVFNYRIKNCQPGYFYSIRITVIEALGTISNKSKFHIVQTCAPPDIPVLKLRACNFKYITMEWSKPNTYGPADITAYKIYLDGKSAALLTPEQSAFTLTNGVACHEYKFQLQALTSKDKLMSPISQPVCVIWPGIQAPHLRIIENNYEVLRVGWDEPKIVGNSKISYYRVICNCEQTGQYLVQGPFDVTMRECEFRGLDAGKHRVQLEINAYGSTEPFFSNYIYVDFGYKPEAPYLVFNIPALDERRKIDKIACSLLNKRDRLLKIIANNGFSQQSKEYTKIQIEQAVALLSQLDESLDDCLTFIDYYTGYFVVNLSWKCEQPNPAVKIVGYRIYVNDKPYGQDLNDTATSIRIKLSLEKVKYSIYVSAFTTMPYVESQKSNMVEFLSESFLPFSFFCFHNNHSKNTRWPKQGCCLFRDSLVFERHNLAKTREVINIGLYAIPQPVPLCKVVDVRSGKPIYLVESNSDLIKKKMAKVTVVLFWAKWCLPSMKTLSHLVNYSRKNAVQYDFIACHHGNENLEELRDLLNKTGFGDSNVRFTTDSTELLKIHNIPEFSLLYNFDVQGLPTMILTNRDGLLAWKGRFASYDYTSFENFMHHTLSEVSDATCPLQYCDHCRNDIDIEPDITALRTEQKYLNQYKDKLHKPTNEAIQLQLASNARSKSTASASKQIISVQERPYSASGSSSDAYIRHMTRNGSGTVLPYANKLVNDERITAKQKMRIKNNS